MGIPYDERDNIFGERLRRLRNDIMRKTQKDLSQLLGIPQPTLSAYESGKNKPTIDVVIKIAEKCNVSIDWLCGRDSPSRINSLGDLISVFYDIYDSKEFDVKTEIQNRVDLEGKERYNDATRNWIKLTFYYNDFRFDKSLIYSMEVTRSLETAYHHHKELVDYEYSQEYYDNQKAERIESLSKFPITQIDFSEMTEEERKKKRIEKLKEEWEKELKELKERENDDHDE